MKGAVDTKIFGAYDLVAEIVRMRSKQKLYKKFVEKPQRLKGHINKLDIDIGAYEKGLLCILKNCDRDTLEHFHKMIKYKYPSEKGNAVIEIIPEVE